MPSKSLQELNFKPILAGLLVAVSLGGLAYAAVVGWDILFPESVHDARMDSTCDLHAGPCSARFGDNSEITLTISPSRPVANAPLRVTVQAIGHVSNKVDVALQGARMKMGLISAPLLDIGHGYFAGDTSLPMCVRNRMRWSALVTSHGPQGRYRATFEFDMYSR